MVRLARYAAAPTTAHLAAGKTVLRYVKGTAELALHYSGAAELTGSMNLDFAVDLHTRRSTSALLFAYNGVAVSWGSKARRTVSLSTTESEYVAAATSSREGVARANTGGHN